MGDNGAEDQRSGQDIIAFNKEEAISLFQDEESVAAEFFIKELFKLRSTASANCIPTATIGSEYWIVEDEDEASAAITLMAKVAGRIDHQPDGNSETTFTMRSTEALESGKGNCFDIASVLAAVLRLNGIPAKVTGNPSFFSQHPDGGDHWWVNAYIADEARWQALDAYVQPVAKTALDKILRNMGSDRAEQRDLFVAMLVKLFAREIPCIPIMDERFAAGLEEALDAAERQLEPKQ